MALLKEFSVVALTADLPEYGLKRGDTGAIVMVHEDHGGGYEVEFITMTGQTVAVVTLTPRQVRAIGPREIASARTLDAA